MKWVFVILSVALVGTVYGQDPAPENPCIGNTLTWVNNPNSCPEYYWCSSERINFPGRCLDNFNFVESLQGCQQDGECIVCPPTGVIRVADSTNCQDYILCIEGEEFPRSCSTGALFDRESRDCQLAANVECDPFSIPDNCDPASTGVVFVADTISCAHFQVCHDGVLLERRECGKGLLFDSVTEGCAVADTVVCPASTQAIPQPPHFTKNQITMRQPVKMPVFRNRFGFF